MKSSNRLLLALAVALLVASGFGTIHLARAESTLAAEPAPVVTTGPQVSPLVMPDASAAADAVAVARATVGERVAAEAAAAARPRYSCEPTADARVIDGIIVNKDCPALTAAKEAAQRTFAEQNWEGGRCIGYGCSPEQDAEITAGEVAAQQEYWARCADTPPGVDDC